MEPYREYLYFDKPIPYKDLLIYPVKMKDYIPFHIHVNCLLLDKNSINDINVISMPYLKFLYHISEVNQEPYVYMFRMLLCLVLQLDEKTEMHFYVRDNKAFFSIKGVEYDSDDFDNISKIIMLQNCIEPIDYTIQKEIRDELAKAEMIKSQMNNNKICSLEEQMICVMITTPLKLEDIYELTIRKFEKTLKRVDAKMHYEIYLSASLSGFVEFKNKDAIQYWMNEFKGDKYSDVTMEMEQMKNKINEINK